MNPAIDKTLDVNGFQAGNVHRVTKVIQDAGGKGINVSKTSGLAAPPSLPVFWGGTPAI